MGDDLQPGVPAIPPKMEVGYNYPWAFNRYGTHIGPRDDPPKGIDSDVAVFRDITTHPPEGSLAKNLTFIRDELKIKKVRMFLLCNAWNYGDRPLVPKGIFRVPDLHPLFLKHFREMLEVFKAKGMQILPSLIDFGAFYELDAFDLRRRKFVGAGSGRTEIAVSGKKKFLNTVLKPMVAISKEPAFVNTIFAWEVVNEPRWNLVNVSLIRPLLPSGRPHTETTGNDLNTPEMADFIQDALQMIQSEGDGQFHSTVGHRFLSDLLSPMPTGTKPQFHYYAKLAPPSISAFFSGDPNPIPTFAELARDSRTKGAFVGEIACAVDVPWPELNKADNSVRTAAFERLKLLARKGYELVFVWPDGGGDDAKDELKLSSDAIESVKQFTRGKFPNGVP